ncbi:MAG: TorD/DmsD family molecular chaperone [Planctomycetota bacterium]|jgi:TorA maturation chaperone TorD
MESTSVRRALYVLFGRLFAGDLTADLYRRVRSGGLDDLARIQGVDLFSDLLDADDAESAVVELAAEQARLDDLVSLRASEYSDTTGDPVLALDAFLREHELEVGHAVDLPHDHLALVLGVMGELAQREEEGRDEDAPLHARAFFLRHVLPWAPRALMEVSAQADRRFYRGLATMLSAFLETERRRYDAA